MREDGFYIDKIVLTTDPNYDPSATASGLGPVESSQSQSAPDHPPLELHALAVASDQIDLTWIDDSMNETGFEVEYRQSGGTFALYATAAANATSYSVTGLSAGAGRSIAPGHRPTAIPPPRQRFLVRLIARSV